MPQLDTCTTCGVSRGGSLRYCPGCGADYWDLASREAPPDVMPDEGHPPATRSAGLSTLLLTVGGLLGVAAVCGFVLLAFVNVDLQSLRPSGPGTIDVPVPSVDSETAAEGERIVRTFMEVATAPDATYHYVGDAAVYASKEGSADRTYVGEMSLQADIAGDSGRGTMEFVLVTGESVAMEFVGVGDTVWVRQQGTSAWASEPAGDEPNNPFLQLTSPDQLQYLGTEMQGGRILHRLRTTAWLGGDTGYLSELEPGLSITRQESFTDIYVTDEGIPVAMSGEGRITLSRGPFDSMVVMVDGEYDFSAWGEPVTITAPA